MKTTTTVRRHNIHRWNHVALPNSKGYQLNNGVAGRFWAKVQKTETCWLWVAGTDRDGYGQFLVGRLPHRAHRISWALYHGTVPDGAHVLHTCDIPRCVNPAHLFLGDQAINMRDRSEKGRYHRTHEVSHGR